MNNDYKYFLRAAVVIVTAFIVGPLLLFSLIKDYFPSSKSEEIETFAVNIQSLRSLGTQHVLYSSMLGTPAARTALDTRESRTQYYLPSDVLMSTTRSDPFTGKSTAVIFGVGGGFEEPEHDITHFRWVYDKQAEVTVEIDKAQLDPEVCAKFAPNVLRCIAWPPKDALASPVALIVQSNSRSCRLDANNNVVCAAVNTLPPKDARVVPAMPITEKE